MLDPLAAAKRAGRGAPEELRIVELGGDEHAKRGEEEQPAEPPADQSGVDQLVVRDVASRSAASVAVTPVFGEDSAVPRLSGPQSSVFG
jgi:hypothetical protein